MDASRLYTLLLMTRYTSGVGGFITNALGGNAFSGATDLIPSFGSGEGGDHSVFYNMGQGVVAGPTQGFGAAFGKSVEGTPWASGASDVTTAAVAGGAFSLVTGVGQSVQTINGAASRVLKPGQDYERGGHLG
jgi:hypothetical protein